MALVRVYYFQYLVAVLDFFKVRIGTHSTTVKRRHEKRKVLFAENQPMKTINNHAAIAYRLLSIGMWAMLPFLIPFAQQSGEYIADALSNIVTKVWDQRNLQSVGLFAIQTVVAFITHFAVYTVYYLRNGSHSVVIDRNQQNLGSSRIAGPLLVIATIMTMIGIVLFVLWHWFIVKNDPRPDSILGFTANTILAFISGGFVSNHLTYGLSLILNKRSIN